MGSQDDEGGLVEGCLRHLGRLIHRRPRLLTALVLLSVLPATWLASRLEIKTSFLDLLPEQETPVRQLRRVAQHARATSDVLVAIPRDDPELAERFASELMAALGERPRVVGIGGWIDLSWFRDRRLMYVDESELDGLRERAERAIDREVLRQTGLYIDLEDEEAESPDALFEDIDEAEGGSGPAEWVITTGGRYLCVWAFVATPSSDLSAARSSYRDVRAVVDRLRERHPAFRDLPVRYAGGLPARVEEDEALRRDLSVAGAVGFFSVVLFIVLALRTPRALVLLSLPLLSGLAWTFGFAALAVGHLNIISGFLFSILSGLGVEYGIHLLHRYRELREEGLELEPAIERLLPSTGRALVSGALTNASVFAIIALAQFRGFSEFGLIAAAGLLITLLTTIVGLPSLLVVLERWRPMRFPDRERGAKKGGVVVPRPLRIAIVLLVPLIAGASAVLLWTGEPRFDGSWRLLAGDTESNRLREYLYDHLGGRHPAALLWVREGVDLPVVRRVIDEVGQARRSAGEPWDVVHISSLDDVYPPPERQRARAAIVRQLGAQLDRIRPGMLDEAGRARLADARRVIRSSRPFSVDQLPYSTVGYLLTSDGTGSITSLLVQRTDETGTEVLTAWAAQARDVAAALERAGLDVPMLSENWVAGEIFERIARDGRFILLGTFAVVFIVLLLDLRALRPTLAVLGSVGLGVLSIAGGMWLTGLRLNFMNVAILPVCVAISLDNAIHVHHRWRGGGPGSIPMVLRQTTVANALASTTNLIGLGALALTHHAGLRSMAYLAALGVGLTYLSTSIFFPMALASYDALRASEQPAPPKPCAEQDTRDG